MSATTKPTLLDEVRTAYADAGPQRDNPAFAHEMRCLSFLTSDWMDVETAVEAGHLIESYNGFDSDALEDALRRIEEVAPDVKVAVGREGSPAFYFQTDSPEAVIDVLDGMGSGGAFSARPDELSITDYVGGARSGFYEPEGDIAVHQTCRHEQPPVAVEDFAEPDPEKEYVRAWWD